MAGPYLSTSTPGQICLQTFGTERWIQIFYKIVESDHDPNVDLNSGMHCLVKDMQSVSLWSQMKQLASTRLLNQVCSPRQCGTHVSCLVLIVTASPPVRPLPDSSMECCQAASHSTARSPYRWISSSCWTGMVAATSLPELIAAAVYRSSQTRMPSKGSASPPTSLVSSQSESPRVSTSICRRCYHLCSVIT